MGGIRWDGRRDSQAKPSQKAGYGTATKATKTGRAFGYENGRALLNKFPKDDPSFGQRAQCASGHGEVIIEGGGDLMRHRRGWSSAHTTMKPPKARINKQTNKLF